MHKEYIKAFWDTFGGTKNNGWYYPETTKLEMLKVYSDIVVEYKYQIPREIRRVKFDKVKYSRHNLKSHSICFACKGNAEIRHHIIALKNGGINSKRNLVSLCRQCHAKIHSWL